ncbi:MAG: hypothetical protein M3T96_10830 [Acidobacteriota bacterium]|nr:hypothetical protein [Acidobacteriota bacterium]
MYEVPDSVILEVSVDDTQLSFTRKALMEAAHLAGLPLLEAVSFSLVCLPASLNDQNFKTDWARTKDDPTPQDGIRVKNNEFVALRGKRITYYLTDEEKFGLKLRQMFYTLHGGVLGSKLETLLDNLIIINLNIVYQDDQYNLQEALVATKATVTDCQNAYSAIDVKFNVIYTRGKGDTSYINDKGAYGRIDQGAKEGMVNVLLFANNGYHGGRSSSLYNPDSEQIFIWEGSVDATPRSKNVSDTLSSAAIAHELAHLFFHYAGLSIKESASNNWSQEKGIYYSLNQMRYNPLFFPDPKLPDDFNYTKDLTHGITGIMPSLGFSTNPSYEQLIRIGAKRVAKHLYGRKQ